MPPSRKNFKAEKSRYQWICGGMSFIRHVELIARGGFGEVHKVTQLHRLLFSATGRLDAQREDWKCNTLLKRV